MKKLIIILVGILLTGNVGLYAKDPPYIVVFDANKGKIEGSSTITKIFVSEEKIPDYNIEREDYIFRYWVKKSQNGQTRVDIITQGIDTLIAVWKKESYTVTFDANGGNFDGSNGIPKKKVEKGTNLVLTNIPTATRMGYRFKGWGLKRDNTEIIDHIIITKDSTLYAIWEEETSPAKIKVTFNANGGKFKERDSIICYEVDSGEKVTFNNAPPTKTDHEFQGWSVDNQEEVAFDTFTITQDVTFYAVWKKEDKHSILAIDKLERVIFCIFVSLLLGLGGFLFWKTKKKNKEIANLKNGIEGYKSNLAEVEKEKSDLEDKKNNLSNENARLKKENEKLKDDLRKQFQQKQQSGNDRKQQSDTPSPSQSRSISLYADSIIDGKFNCVRETPNEDTIFELKLNSAGDTRANVVVYKPAYRRVIARSSFLDGCEKQILGNTNVIMQDEGVATKDGNGNWTISTKPKVKIS
jgi:uncharacterized repeat protein (TIGR02543 family)